MLHAMWIGERTIRHSHVFGDAEWIGVLHEKGGRSKLRASGSIDAADVKEFAANILEGGREAFNHRREKYGL